MAKYTISQFTLVNGDIIELKDKVAREAVKGGTHFIGVTTSEISDGSTTNPVVIPTIVDGQSTDVQVTAVSGDIVIKSNKEFIFSASDSKWHELGDLTGLGSLATKNSASGNYTPAGTITASFSGTTISYTPEGSVSKPNVTVTPTTATIKEFDGAGSVTNGSAASCTMPTLTFTPDAATENLTISWTDGSFTPNTPTAVTLPTSKETSVMTGAAAELDAAPTFSGTAASFAVEGDVEATFSGTLATITVE